MVKYSTVNAIPTMTSNTSPSGEAFANSFNASNLAYYAFDDVVKNNDSWWESTQSIEAWVGYKFSNAKIIGAYSITSGSPNINDAPKSWTFEGSNDGVIWEVLDTINNEPTWTASEKRLYYISNTKEYSRYRLYIKGSQKGGATYHKIQELEMFEVIYEKNAIIKNQAKNQFYSLDNKTLINLPSSSDKNMILHGIESGKEIKLNENFDKMKYVQDTSEVLGEGKTFTHIVDTSKLKINKIIL